MLFLFATLSSDVKVPLCLITKTLHLIDVEKMIFLLTILKYMYKRLKYCQKSLSLKSLVHLKFTISTYKLATPSNFNEKEKRNKMQIKIYIFISNPLCTHKNSITEIFIHIKKFISTIICPLNLK
jgi:hypothetical protein